MTNWNRYKRLTDIQEIQNNFKIVQKYPKNFSENFRNISYPELEIALYQPNFRKKVSQLTDRQTYKKFGFVYTNIAGFSLKLEISQYLSNFSKEVSQLTDRQTYKKFKTF